MNILKAVLNEYFEHILRLANRPETHKRNLGIAYYIAAAERVLALIEAPTPAWVLVQFKKRSAFE